MTTLTRTCRKCGAKLFAEAKFCSACLLETALDPFEGLEESTPANGGAPMAEFGNYQLLEEVGRGGQGVVYRARQKSLNRIVALKVVALGHWASTPHLKRFRHEAEAAAALEHPRIVPIYEIGESDGSCYFSMKFVEGGQLDELVRQEPLPVRQAAELLVKIARTVQFAHARGILHRDIKPGNILLDREGEPHLTDFGLARLIENESTVTNSFDVLGTPSYMAPEQAAGKARQLTGAVDVYSLGAVLYHVLTGHPPFAGGTTYETIRLVMDTDPRNPRLWNPKIDLDLSTICLTCLEKDPQRRYPSAEALAEDLERWLKHEPIKARSAGFFSRGKKWVQRNPMTTVAAVALVALLVLLSSVVWKSDLLRAAPDTGLAVLPFQNLSGDKSTAYFVDGIQDEILTRLARVNALRVSSRTSTEQYDSQPRNVRQIAHQLGVAHVLEGSVRKFENRARISVQLIRVATDEPIWAESYDGDLAEVPQVEGNIATSVAHALNLRLTSTEQQFLEEKPTANAQAYDAFLRGLDYALRPHPGNSDNDILAALKYFDAAVQLDPDFARAWAWITRVSSLGYFNVMTNDPPALREKARQAAANVQRLAPNLPEAWLAQGFFQDDSEERYDAAITAFERARDLVPGSSEPLDALGLVWRRKNLWAKSLGAFQQAIAMDPRNLFLLNDYADTLCEMRDYASALRVYDRILEMSPQNADAIASEASIYQARADLQEAAKWVAKLPPASNAEQWYRTEIRQSVYERRFADASRLLEDALKNPVQPLPDSDKAEYRAWLANVLQWSGDPVTARAKWEQVRNEIETFLRAKTAEPCYANPRTWLAEAYAAVGDKGKAHQMISMVVDKGDGDQLEIGRLAVARAQIATACGDRDLAIQQVAVAARSPVSPGGIDYGDLEFNPRWDSLRGDSRFEKVVASLTPKN